MTQGDIHHPPAFGDWDFLGWTLCHPTSVGFPPPLPAPRHDPIPCPWLLQMLWLPFGLGPSPDAEPWPQEQYFQESPTERLRDSWENWTLRARRPWLSPSPCPAHPLLWQLPHPCCPPAAPPARMAPTLLCHSLAGGQCRAGGPYQTQGGPSAKGETSRPLDAFCGLLLSLFPLQSHGAVG